ncbi:MAG: hypothetical protein ACI4GZ_03160 [Ruminococcus sp.]
MDVLIKDGDILTDYTGSPVYISGIEEIVQRVKLCISVEKGKFIYMKELGLDRAQDISSEAGIRNFEAKLREAVALLEGVELQLLSLQNLTETERVAKLNIIYNNESVEAEVKIQ